MDSKPFIFNMMPPPRGIFSSWLNPDSLKASHARAPLAAFSSKPSSSLKPLSFLLLTLLTSPAFADSESNTIADVEVSASRNPIAATYSTSGTKTDTPIVETPQSISVVNRREMDARGAQSWDDAMNYTPGYHNTFANQAWTYYQLRGFASSAVHYNGVAAQSYVVGSETEPYGLERVEVLKGPSSVLYGQSIPGGLINFVTKKPLSTPLRELQASFGAFHRKQIAADFSGPLTKDKTLMYRVTGLLRRADGWVKHQPDDSDFLAASLQWQPNQDFSFTLMADMQKNNRGYGNYEFLGGKGILSPLADGSYIPRDFFIGEPDHNHWRTKYRSIGYQLDYNITPNVKLTHELRHSYASSKTHVTRFGQLDDDGRTLRRDYVDIRDAAQNVLSSDTRLEYRWGGDTIQHTSLFGVNYSRNSGTGKRHYREITTPIDVLNPVYGHYEITPLEPEDTDKGRYNQLRVYLQDQIKINNRWVVLGGLGYDWVDFSSKDAFTGKVAIDSEKSKALTWRAGAVYLFENGFAPYVSFSTSFQPQHGRDRFGNRFDPRYARQYEVGARYQPPGSDTLLTAALYNLERRNDKVADPADRKYQIQVGKTRSRGVELEAKTAIGKHTHLTAGYAYTDARIVKSSPLTPERKGVRMTAIPYHQFSLWTDHKLASLGLPDWTVGLGMRFQKNASDGMGNLAPGSTKAILDAMVAYEHGSWKVALHAKNLANHRDLVCTYGDCMYGAPRQFNVAGTYRW